MVNLTPPSVILTEFGDFGKNKRVLQYVSERTEPGGVTTARLGFVLAKEPDLTTHQCIFSFDNLPSSKPINPAGKHDAVETLLSREGGIYAADEKYARPS